MIQNNFSIKDLENLSGIKSHTIRIWEKRYDLLEPERSNTNIRFYSNDSLRKLLNICYLKDQGNKISKIAQLSEEELEEQVRSHAFKINDSQQEIQSLKMSMLQFNRLGFDQVYKKSLESRGFEATFKQLILPFLEELGLLWHSNTIDIAHEHFVSHLIKQKLLTHTELLDSERCHSSNTTFILYLPQNEIHDLGLLYTNYKLIHEGYKTVYLGASIPDEELHRLKESNTHTVFVTYLTVEPKKEKLKQFLQGFNNNISEARRSQLYILGKLASEIDPDFLQPNFKVFSTIADFTDSIQTS
ncbi:MAG: MerR family transcriptional regulator [Nonlabens sp.]